MKRHTFETITGRKLNLAALNAKEAEFLSAVHARYENNPEWSEFAAWWTTALKKAGLAEDSVVYRICQDLEARLGIAQGKVGPPDYRDYLADLIEERYGSRYRFCKETGFDPGHLSRVFAGRSELSLQTLQQILAGMHASLVIRLEEDLAENVSPLKAARALAAAGR
jgi:hypothetical protein